MRVLTGILAVAALIGFHGPVQAQQALGPDDLASALGLGVPSWWTVGTVEIQASEVESLRRLVLPAVFRSANDERSPGGPQGHAG